MMAKSRTSKLQMNTLVELMSNDPKLSAGKFSENFTRKIANARWEEIAIELNSLPGCEKSGYKWKKAWQDTIAKHRTAVIKSHTNGTGGGPATNLVMSDAQLDSISLMRQEAISGHLNALKPSVTYKKPVEQTASYIYDKDAKTTGEGMSSEQPMKKESAYEKLSDSNKAAWKMVDLASKKLNIKSNYYDQKLILLRQKNNILRNINTLLETYIQNKTRSRERKRRRSRDRNSREIEYDEVEEIPVTKFRDKDHDSESKRKRSHSRESQKNRKERDHHRRDKSKDSRDEHDKGNSERDDKIHTKQEPVDEYDNNYDSYNDEYDNGYNSPHDDDDPYLVKQEVPNEERANGSRYSNNAI